MYINYKDSREEKKKKKKSMNNLYIITRDELS